MILSDFLSRQIEDDSNPHEIIPISFRHLGDITRELSTSMTTDTYNVQIRVQAKAQANAPTILNTQPKGQKVTPKVAKLPIKTEEKEGDIKKLPSRIIRTTPKKHCVAPRICVTPNCCAPK